MKLLHFADLHLDASFAWAPAAVASRRRQAIRDTLREICRVARERNVDALTCAGDLYEQERFTGDTSQFLVSTFAELHPLPILVAPGNHDWLAPSSIYETAAWSSNVHIFRSDRLEPIDLAPGFTVWGGGHRAPANTDDFLHDFRARAFGVNLGLFHASERSTLPHQEAGKQPHAPFSAHEIADAGLDHALLGHYHAPVDGANFTYPGNPEPLSFGETGERGAVLVEIDREGSVRRERIRVARTVVEDMDVDISGAGNFQEVLDRLRKALAGHSGIVRVSLKGDVSPSLSLDRIQLEQPADGLEYMLVRTDDVRPVYDLDTIRTETTVRGQFVRDVLAATIDDNERQRVLITGLRALAGRTDLEVEE